MREITLEELLEAGCHFGHQVTRHNPKSRDFVFEARDNIHIIDLAKTKEGLESAAAFVKHIAESGKTLVVVGSKQQASDLVKEEVKRARVAGADGIYWVTARWIGGLLTNFSEVSKNFKKLQNYTDLQKNEIERSKYTKKELGLFEKERQKLENLYGGISEIPQAPQSLFIIDTHLEDLAVREATKTGVETVGIVDTNADPFVITHPIPANDDAVGSIKLIVTYIVDAWIEGRMGALKKKETEETQTPKETKGTDETKVAEEKVVSAEQKEKKMKKEKVVKEPKEPKTPKEPKAE